MSDMRFCKVHAYAVKPKAGWFITTSQFIIVRMPACCISFCYAAIDIPTGSSHDR